MLLVVVFHANFFVTQYGGLERSPWVQGFNTALAPLRIPMLLLLSGMLLPASLAKGRSRYLSGKLRNVAWPYAVWVLLWGALSWPVYSLVGFALGGSYLWFMLYLLVFYLVAWPLRRVPPQWLVLGAAAASAVASVVSGGREADPFSAERWLYLFAVFMAGHLLTRRAALTRWLLTSPWALVLAVVLVVVHRALGLGLDYGTGSAPLFVAGAVVVLRLARASAGARVLGPVRFVGRNSIVYYLVHYPVLAAVASAAAVVGATSAEALLAVLLVVTLLLCTLLARARHLPVVSWLFQAPRLPSSRGTRTAARL